MGIKYEVEDSKTLLIELKAVTRKDNEKVRKKVENRFQFGGKKEQEKREEKKAELKRRES